MYLPHHKQRLAHKTLVQVPEDFLSLSCYQFPRKKDSYIIKVPLLRMGVTCIISHSFTLQMHNKQSSKICLKQ